MIHRSTSRKLAQVGTAVAEVDNGTVLRHAFEEAMLRSETSRRPRNWIADSHGGCGCIPTRTRSRHSVLAIRCGNL
ncbi:hypothetical protein [Mycobacterium intracellulare]|uniref:Uncharacterized protein n=1 Tax=Mycobacterium intracellulare TaxID=1767 RepID=A0AAE4RF14_MYCIT|nr:hypothetical protein [Mycobacterium intracellulare]MDV6977306.1 hypothetical protein [Mycobacterium intracellulare]MDV6982787.1 hypothetical protein [Mycobacterium intracellulare]MDV7013013.1 hypothetical protein [Mycobacterium intracellulare]MDV7028149.1 hypothetical protein [Mycobacterium intracellulare]